MGKSMEIVLKRLEKRSERTKLESAPPSAMAAAGDDSIVTAIIRVNEPNDVPPTAHVRAEIDSR
jgi:hypothetical protein